MEDNIIGLVEIAIIAFIVYIFWYSKHLKNKKQVLEIKIKNDNVSKEKNELFRKDTLYKKNDSVTVPKTEKLILTEEEISYFINNEIENRIKDLYSSESVGIDSSMIDFSKRDPLFVEAAHLIVENQQGSTALIQRKFSIGYNRAGRIVDQLEVAGIIGPFEGSKARQVLVLNDFRLNHILKNLGCDNGGSETEIYFKEHVLPTKIDYIEKKVQEISLQKEEQKIAILKEDIKQQLLKKEKEKTEKSRVQELEDQVRKEMIERGELLNDLEEKERRKPIPQNVQDKVWNRDGGQCVNCGSREKLEFDHIIPFSKGGSDTFRNLQLLCERCNRQKHNKIG
jgi:hypothetical protein